MDAFQAIEEVLFRLDLAGQGNASVPVLPGALDVPHLVLAEAHLFITAQLQLAVVHRVGQRGQPDVVAEGVGPAPIEPVQIGQIPRDDDQRRGILRLAGGHQRLFKVVLRLFPVPRSIEHLADSVQAEGMERARPERAVVFG